MSAATKWHDGDAVGTRASAAEGDVLRRKSPSPSFRERLSAALAIVHRVIGAPDYDAYLSHLRCHHPDHPPLSRDEFVRQRLEDRYSRPGARCC